MPFSGGMEWEKMIIRKKNGCYIFLGFKLTGSACFGCFCYDSLVKVSAV